MACLVHRDQLNASKVGVGNKCNHSKLSMIKMKGVHSDGCADKAAGRANFTMGKVAHIPDSSIHEFARDKAGLTSHMHRCNDMSRGNQR